MSDKNALYRDNPDWDFIRTRHVERVADIPDHWDLASLSRTKASHKGIGKHKQLTTLFASAVNQEFLDEICELERLERLWLGWPCTASNLSGMVRLSRLRHLSIEAPRNVVDFGPITALPALERLFVEQAKHMTGLEWLEPLRDRLKVLGIEGSIWTKQKVPSLAPLSNFAMEALFMTSVQLADKDLTPLATCQNLKFIGCARFAPKENFDALKALRPDIECSWFDRYEI